MSTIDKLHNERSSVCIKNRRPTSLYEVFTRKLSRNSINFLYKAVF